MQSHFSVVIYCICSIPLKIRSPSFSRLPLDVWQKGFWSNKKYGVGLHLCKKKKKTCFVHLSHWLYLLFNQLFSDKGHRQTSKPGPQIWAHSWSEKGLVLNILPWIFFFFFFAIVAINLFKNRIRFDKLGPGVMCFIPQHGLQNKKKPSPLSSRGGKKSEIEEKQSLM